MIDFAILSYKQEFYKRDITSWYLPISRNDGFCVEYRKLINHKHFYFSDNLELNLHDIQDINKNIKVVGDVI
jgi:hypothetical protein